jgi:hypothetical protein
MLDIYRCRFHQRPRLFLGCRLLDIRQSNFYPTYLCRAACICSTLLCGVVMSSVGLNRNGDGFKQYTAGSSERWLTSLSPLTVCSANQDVRHNIFCSEQCGVRFWTADDHPLSKNVVEVMRFRRTDTALSMSLPRLVDPGA